jgi:geranylgeranyl pyrophosphate synthase
MGIIETGRIDAIVGVSCMSVLERAFSPMEAAAIPGIAIPLLRDGCRDTAVDEDWVWDVIHLTSDDKTRRMDLGALREEVDSWLAASSLEEVLGKPAGETEKIAQDWLSRAGKRWRPFLTVAAHQALQDEPRGEIPPDLKKVALAVECFHKASLVHDDIEDQDSTRYGERTLHEEHGVPVALNVGDYLLGEGYRLLAECAAPAATRARMLHVASQGHRTLALGQGAELCWARDPYPMSSRDVLGIFSQKTAPAFEVALHLGVLYASSAERVRLSQETLAEVIAKYSRALGIAYQIRDDLEDLTDGGEACDLAMRPTLPLALACERAAAGSPARELLESVWRRRPSAGVDSTALRAALEELGAPERAREMLEAYKREAVRSLWDVENPNLKGLLRRVIGKVFGDARIEGWCHDYQARNAADREAGTQPAA